MKWKNTRYRFKNVERCQRLILEYIIEKILEEMKISANETAA